MPRFWWVNHKQTARHEVEGQYLWSPKTEANGSRSEFYNNMRRAAPGDLVLSYADQVIRSVGRVTDFAFTAPKPEEFGDTGSYWSDEGWLLPVLWTPLVPGVRPKALLEALRPLLPDRYSPINSITGGGNQKAYLASISQPVFDLVTTGSVFSQTALEDGDSKLNFTTVSELLDDVAEEVVAHDLQLADTTRESVILARRGQGAFRTAVEAVERSCRLTGVSDPRLLIASHIKPWRNCTSAQERLDGNNGLLLTPDADLLFDRGLMSFNDDGEVLVSPRMDVGNLRRLGFGHLVVSSEISTRWRTRSFAPKQAEYLAYHRRDVFVQ